MKKKTRKKEKEGVSKRFGTRKQAMRAFKKDYDIPNSEQPKEVVKPLTAKGDEHDLDERNVRLYVFRAIFNLFRGTKRRKTHLREDNEASYVKGDGYQDKHFNAGHPDEKLKDHYYFGKKKKHKK